MRPLTLFCLLFASILLATPMQSHSASVEDQEAFAANVRQLINDNELDYAKAALDKYLEIDPAAGPVKRTLAHYYMKTTAETHDDLVVYRYPDEMGEKIITLLSETVEANPEDKLAWSLLVYTHALQNNIEEGKQALKQAQALPEQDSWLGYNAALLAIRDNNLREAVDYLAPIAIDKRISGRDTKNVIRNSWILLRKIGLQEPSLDPQDAVRDGLATRVDLKLLPEYLDSYDKNAKPILLIFTSQESGCTYCVSDLTEMYQAVQYNKDKGSPLHVVYSSIEPWTDARYYSSMLRSLGITGGPAYNIVHKGFHIHSIKQTKTRLDTLRSFIDDPETMISKGKAFAKVLPRKDYLLDHVYAEFIKYKKIKGEGYKSMAYVLNGPHWKSKTVKEQATQKDADELALSECNKLADAAKIEKPCRIYARNNKIVDAKALARSKARRSELRMANKQSNKKKKAAQATAKPATRNQSAKQTTEQGSAAAAGMAIKQYAKNEDHFKALAIAQNADASVAGMATKMITQSRAIAKALDECETARAEFDLAADCVLHSIGKVEVTDQSQKDIDKLIARQQKRNVKNSAMGASYKKYRKFSSDKAFAYSVDAKENWVNGMAFGKRGTDKASDAAIAECEKKRVEKGLPDACVVLILNSQFVDQP